MRTFDVRNVRIIYYNKSFGQKFIDYLGPNYYNLMPLHLKKLIFSSIGKLKITYIEHQINSCLFSLFFFF